MNKRLEYIAEILESWAEGQLNQPLRESGICLNLAYLPRVLGGGWERLVAVAAASWTEYSGDAHYPVPHPDLLPESAYTATYDIPKWGDDAYGQARRRLCQHIADWIRANPEAAAELLSED